MTMREEVYEELHPVLEKIVDMVCEHIDTLEDNKVPEVELILKEDCDCELLINGESVCCDKSLYVTDVLEALDEHGIINYIREERL